MKYHFSAFIYDTEQKILYHDEQPVEMTKKNHELLLFLLENPDRLIAREALIEHVWHGRVVTNNTIDQCIMKLRKTLNQVQPDDYIESVYGQGIRFLPNIQTATVNTGNHTGFKTGAITLVVMLVFLSAWLLFKPDTTTPDTTGAQTPELKVLTQAQLNNSTSAHDWLNLGAAAYLSHLLNQHPEIKALKPRKSDSQALTLELLTPKAAQQTITVNVSQVQDSPVYQATVGLSANDEPLHSQVITTNLLTELYPQIADWVAQQLQVGPTETSHLSEVFSNQESALTSYLHGMSKQQQGDSQQALTYFEAAVEVDPQFKMAWYEMAIAMRKQGDPRKAIGVLKAIDSEDPSLSYRVALVMAQCLDSVGDFAAAEQSYEKAMQWAEQDQDPGKLAAVLISQAILYRKTQRYDEAKQVLEQAASITDKNQQPHLYGTIMSTHAKLAKAINKPLLAIEKAQLAIQAFQQAGDLRYQMQTKTVLASILRQRNEFSQAEKLVKESLFHAEQLQHRRGISDNRTKLARLYQQTGRFDLAYEQWQLVLSLNDALALYGNSGDAHLWLLKLHLAENKIAQADIELNMLAQLYKEHPKPGIKLLLDEAQLLMAIHQQQAEVARPLVYALADQQHPLATMYRGDLAMLEQQAAAAELHYLEALVLLNAAGRYDWLTTILNRLNALYTEHNSEKLADNLVRTQRLKPFIYPRQKYQAQLAMMNGNSIQAISLMEELKLKAGDYWQASDEQLLTQFKTPANQP